MFRKCEAINFLKEDEYGSKGMHNASTSCNNRKFSAKRLLFLQRCFSRTQQCKPLFHADGNGFIHPQEFPIEMHSAKCK